MSVKINYSKKSSAKYLNNLIIFSDDKFGLNKIKFGFEVIINACSVSASFSTTSRNELMSLDSIDFFSLEEFK